MSLSHEVRGSGRRASGGLAARVLAGSVLVGSVASLAGCGAALVAGAHYAAETDAAKIKARNDRYLAAQQQRSELLGKVEELQRSQAELAARLEELSKPRVYACNDVNPALDGDSSSISEADMIGKRPTNPALFYTNEPIGALGMVFKDYLGKRSTVKLVDNQGKIVESEDQIVIGSGSLVHGLHYESNKLSSGNYKFVWSVDGDVLGLMDIEVKERPSTFSQK